MKNKEKGEWLPYKEALGFKLANSICIKKIENEIGVETLLKRCGFSKRTYYRILKGGNPKFYTLCSIAKALGVELSDLLDFELNEKIKSSERLVCYQFFTDASWKEWRKNFKKRIKHFYELSF